MSNSYPALKLPIDTLLFLFFLTVEYLNPLPLVECVIMYNMLLITEAKKSVKYFSLAPNTGDGHTTEIR